MDSKLDALLAKLESAFDRFLQEFETSPVRTTVKALLVIYVIRKARDVWRGR